MSRFLRRVVVSVFFTALLLALVRFHAEGKIHIFRFDDDPVGTMRTFYQPIYMPLFVEEGVGSWYGPRFHGKRTASGELYDMHDLTAAHMTLPFGTIVRVTNLQTGRSTLVRINDRGPYIPGRILDLSYAAAQELKLYGSGTAEIKLEVYRFPSGYGGEFVSSSTIGVIAIPEAENNYPFAEQQPRNDGTAIALSYDMQPVEIRVDKARVLHETDCLRDALKTLRTLKKSHSNVVLLAERGTQTTLTAEDCKKSHTGRFRLYKPTEAFQYRLAALQSQRYHLQEPSDYSGEVFIAGSRQ
jgi:hypothetical protein